MKFKIFFVFLMLPLFIIFGCNNGDGSNTPPSGFDCDPGDAPSVEVELIQSDKERDLFPEALPEDISRLVESNTAFVLDFYHFLKDEEPNENSFFSPYSISMCFAMLYGGARNNTESQMTDVFHFSLDQESLHQVFNALDLDLLSREQDYIRDGEEGFKLNIVNSMWGQTDYDFLTEYLDLLTENYGVGIQLVDLQDDPVGSSDAINYWVREKTECLIDSIIQPRDLNSFSLFVLVNAIYFKAKWVEEFDEDSTRNDTFYSLDGEVTVPMMQQWCNVYYNEGDNYQAAGIPYKGDNVEMLVLLPKTGSFEQFEASLTPEIINQIVDESEYLEVVLKLPRFEYRPEQLELNNVLSQMGMDDAFIPGIADFSGMDGVPNWIYLDWARHKAFITVDEYGTEAAAVTAGSGVGGGVPETPEIEFIVNRPFIFFIRDRVTNTVLFMGRILNPLA